MAGAFDEFGAGASYGETILTLSAGSPMPQFSVVLNVAAPAGLDAAAGSGAFPVDGALSSLPGQTEAREAVWGSSRAEPAAFLTLGFGEAATALPVPAALPLAVVGRGALLLAARRRRRAV